ncbi:hypothetical protein FJZ36_19045 [Candidatus Poribacteria bacterium]|nr:hypothetical protein [Candidatus Poribacteria bacterium]
MTSSRALGDGEIAAALRPHLHRRRLQAALAGLWAGGLIGSLVVLGLLLVGRLVGNPTGFLPLVGMALTLVAGTVVGRLRAPGPMAMAGEIDERCGLHARIQTAYELEDRRDPSPFAAAQRRDALDHLPAVSLAARREFLSPWRLVLLTLALGAAWTPALLPRRESTETHALTEAVRDATDALDQMSSDATVRDLSERLARVRSAPEAFAALSDIERQLASPSAAVLDAARAELRSLSSAQPLSDGLEQAASNVPPDLAQELLSLRARLGTLAPPPELMGALNEVETAAVSPDTLRRIAHALRALEADSSSRASEALAAIRRAKAAVAAVIDPASAGSVARTDEVPGQESGPGNARGAQLEGFSSGLSRQDTLELDSQLLDTAKQQRVYARRGGEADSPAPAMLPFVDVVLSAQRQADAALSAESIPRAYEERVRAYYAALARITQEDMTR